MTQRANNLPECAAIRLPAIAKRRKPHMATGRTNPRPAPSDIEDATVRGRRQANRGDLLTRRIEAAIRRRDFKTMQALVNLKLSDANDETAQRDDMPERRG